MKQVGTCSEMIISWLDKFHKQFALYCESDPRKIILGVQVQWGSTVNSKIHNYTGYPESIFKKEKTVNEITIYFKYPTSFRILVLKEVSLKNGRYLFFQFFQ